MSLGETPLGACRIDGVRASLLIGDDGGPCLVVRFDAPCGALSSGVVGGGFAPACRAIVNRQVTKDYMADDPEAEMRAFLARHGFADAEGAGGAAAPGGPPTLGMLTAAFVRDAGFAERELADSGRYVACWATVGLGNAARAGRAKAPAGGLFPGTINAVVVVDGGLAPGAYVGAACVAAEAKAAALADLAVRDPDDGGIATGTTTDAVAIVATGRGAYARYAGTATHVGHAVGRVVYDAVRDAAVRYLAYAAASGEK
ncbi:MAG TPA: adenosylcobinamide amidohydrolase [Paenibacillus sp.]|nr:adenosylcobinamide amidohydrolase [Paenibacillus sp.]